MKVSNDESLVLIIDDNLQDLQVLVNFVKEKEKRVVVAQNGEQALSCVDRTVPALILINIMVSDADGQKIWRKLKERDVGKNTPIIFIISQANSENVNKVFEVGGVDYISKPFVRGEVQARIKVHLELKHAKKQLASKEVKDDITGAFNSSFAHEIVDREINFAKRENSSFVLCFVDVDDLKEMNENHGREAGDQLISTIAQGCKGAVRTSDYLFRMGGDEFMLLLPKTGIKDAASLVQRLNEKMNYQDVCGVPIDFSYGFSIFTAGDSISSEELIKEAEANMYEQKRSKKTNCSPGLIPEISEWK